MASTFKINQEGKSKTYSVVVDLYTDGDAEKATCEINWTDSNGNTGSHFLDTKDIATHSIIVDGDYSVSIIISRVDISYYHNGKEAECCNTSVHVECTPPLTWSEGADEVSGEYPGGYVGIYAYGEVCEYED